MTDRLQYLLHHARRINMTSAELAAQRISFAYGNVHYENPRITREDVERAAKRLDAAQEKTQ